MPVLRGTQASIGTASLGLLTMSDALVGSYVVVLDECVKERRRVRTKPYQLDLDDALALTDDDALAKDMFARPSAAGPQSYYMQVPKNPKHNPTPNPTSPCAPGWVMRIALCCANKHTSVPPLWTSC